MNAFVCQIDEWLAGRVYAGRRLARNTFKNFSNYFSTGILRTSIVLAHALYLSRVQGILLLADHLLSAIVSAMPLTCGYSRLADAAGVFRPYIGAQLYYTLF